MTRRGRRHYFSNPPQPQHTTSPANSGFKKFMGILWKVILGIGILAGIIEGWPVVKDLVQPDKGKYEDSKLIKGKLVFPRITPFTANGDTSKERRPPMLSEAGVPHIEKLRGIRIPGLDTMSNLMVSFYENPIIMTIDQLYKGGNLFIPTLKSKWKTNAVFYIGAIDDRVYVSVKILDLQTEDLIAIIDYNQWKIYKDNIFDYNENDSAFEVRDKQGEIAVSINYKAKSPFLRPASPQLTINGYYIDERSVLISGSTIKFPDENYPIISKNEAHYREKARHYIDSIPSLFDKKPSHQ